MMNVPSESQTTTPEQLRGEYRAEFPKLIRACERLALCTEQEIRMCEIGFAAGMRAAVQTLGNSPAAMLRHNMEALMNHATLLAGSTHPLRIVGSDNVQ